MVIPKRSERKYEPYPEYKDFGTEWLKAIPAHWEARRLRFLAKINPSKTEIKALPPSFEVSFLPMEDIGCGILNMEQTRDLSSTSEGYAYFRDGDVLVAKITPCFENGKGAISEGLLNGIGFGTTELHVIRATLDLNRRFLLYITISHAFRDIGESQMYGAAGQKRVSDRFIRDFICPYPCLDEQQTIADFLDCETTRIDELIARKQRLIELLQEQRTALITRTATKGLNPDAPMKDSGVEWLGEIPAHWEVKRLKHISSVKFSGVDKHSKEDEEPVRLCNYTDVYNSDTILPRRDFMEATATKNEIAMFSLKRDDVLITKDSEDWRDIAVPSYVSTNLPGVICGYHLALIRSNSSVINGKYLFWAFCARNINHQFRIAATGITRFGLSKYWLDTSLFLNPPIQEQQAITDYLDRETARIDSLVIRINQAIEKLQEYRSALITAAVTGKFDVRSYSTPGEPLCQ